MGVPGLSEGRAPGSGRSLDAGRQLTRVRWRVLSSENLHVISLGQFLMCRENVGIATTRFQSLNNVEGNYVRHLWGTMRVCGEPCVCGQERAGPAPAGGNRFSPKTRT